MVIAIGGPGLFLGVALWSASERTIYSRQVSPDGRFEARVQFDDCGAACGWAKIVYVKRRWIPSDTPLASCLAFAGDGTGQVRLEWLNDHTLLVRHGFPANQVEDGAALCGSTTIRTHFDRGLISREP